MNLELSEIADDEKACRAFIKFWGDQHMIAQAALETIHKLLVARRDAVDAEMQTLTRELEAIGPGAGTGETGDG